MIKLNFPDYQYSIKSKENKSYIFDPIRKKWLVLNPEEWVRQNCVQFLINEKKFPIGLLQVEKKIEVFNTVKRYDLVVFNTEKKISLLVECKSPSVKITQEAFDQIARYNTVIQSEYLMLTNGLDHFYYQMDFKEKKYIYLTDLPTYNSLK
ncbi:MAG: type I restriction enzyme HsdR N-terminal domain-containing protein [Flavobacteriaceae bacterium]|jgi:hypothetical protein|nr:type I restriction enzyme HsdR N-terminal domain-containing protein [Flavobacteriaceae bacterium]